MGNLQDRLRGSLYGLAIGDALGAAVEFKPTGTFPPVTGFRGGGPHGLKAGEWTDDTSMALALADSISKAGWDIDDQASRYLEWYRKGKYSVNGRCFDIGGQTRQALESFERSRDARTSGNPAETLSGNGSIMRLAPVVVAHAGCFPDRLELLLDRAEESSLPTHPSPICRSACRYLALLLAALAHGLSRDEVLDPSWTLLRRAGVLHPAVRAIADAGYREKEPPAIRGGGYVVASLEAAIWSFHKAADFREAVLQAVNLGDDADTTGAVCGQLGGAFWGEQGIPSEWRWGLAGSDVIESAVKGLLAAPEQTRGGEAADDRERPPTSSQETAIPDPPERSYWIEPGKLLGGCYPGGVDEADRDRKITRLLHLGIRTFIDLTEADETHLGRRLNAYADAVQAVGREQGFEVECQRFPVKDLNPPSSEHMREIVQAIDTALERGPVYVHCLGGVGRTGTAAACWLLNEGKVTGENVFEQLTQLRKMDRERGHIRAPESERQREFVLRWAAEIGSEASPG